MRRETELNAYGGCYSVCVMPRRNVVTLSSESIPRDGQPILPEVGMYLTVTEAREIAAFLLDAANELEKGR